MASAGSNTASWSTYYVDGRAAGLHCITLIVNGRNIRYGLQTGNSGHDFLTLWDASTVKWSDSNSQGLLARDGSTVPTSNSVPMLTYPCKLYGSIVENTQYRWTLLPSMNCFPSAPVYPPIKSQGETYTLPTDYSYLKIGLIGGSLLKVVNPEENAMVNGVHIQHVSGGSIVVVGGQVSGKWTNKAGSETRIIVPPGNHALLYCPPCRKSRPGTPSMQTSARVPVGRQCSRN